MHIGILIVDIHLEGCRSLKEKRRTLDTIENSIETVIDGRVMRVNRETL